ncbi:MAG TPA: aromatic ring-hydroxylating dioxygenase subunit alpha [Terriglobia bacterium]|nr:aromatic ring-hydroxylating dioxygenase subunit alpha [Terriglobia bacterium]
MNSDSRLPAFNEARNPRQKARAAGLHPDYWYPVEYDNAVKPGRVVEVTFWNRSIALFRGTDGNLRALENRCAHRQLKLSVGEVDGCNLVCGYHGWGYNEEGRVVQIPHELFGREMPSFKVPSFPVKVRYGLIWLFPGNPARAAEREIPKIPELEGNNPWACVPIDFTWRAHHSMIIDNVSDFTHAYLHRKYRPFIDAKLTRCEMIGEKVFVNYDTRIGTGRFSGMFVDRDRVDTDHIELCHDYPYQWSNTGGKIKHWCFVLPINEYTTRAFFLFYFDALKIPFTRIRIPQVLMKPLLKIANVISIKPLLRQDGFAVEAEQQGYEKYFDAPLAELNPAVNLFQQLTIRKWEEHIAGDRRA